MTRTRREAIEAARREYANLYIKEIRRMEESAVSMQLGEHFRQTLFVTIRKPRWMPKAMYRALMRTIIITKRFN